MHFTVLYLMKDEELDNISLSEIEEDFSDRYCYCCGETRPRYQYYCDWFSIGGRWCDLLKANRGIRGERSWTNANETSEPEAYSVVEIKDLTENIDIDMIYAIALKSTIIEDREKIGRYLDKINHQKIKGVIALIDCHD